MKVLVACEYSGRVRDAFTKLGHDAMSCDLLETESPGNHFKGDVREVLGGGWDLMIAHPDCTYIANSGVSWLDRDITRWKKLYSACDFFKLFLNHPCAKVVIENPIPHKYGLNWIGQKYSQTIQPYQFGHLETKRTCLWLKGVDPLVETNNVKAEMDLLPKNQSNRLHYLPPSPDRWKQRSRTFQGIADAMAMQWGN